MRYLGKRKSAVMLCGAVVLLAVCIWGVFPSGGAIPTENDPVDGNQTVGDPVARAKKLVADFATSARYVWLEGIGLPQMPVIPPDVDEALNTLQASDDKDYLADIAGLLLRYATEDMTRNGLGHPTNPDERLLALFMSEVRPPRGGDEIVNTILARWICQNRSQLGRSEVLDAEVVRFKTAEKKRAERWKRLLQSSLPD